MGYDLARTVGMQAVGRHDPTTRIADGQLWRATRTPHGPGTVHVWRSGDALRAEAWGPGGDWLLAGVPELVGLHRPLPVLGDHHPLVTRAQARHPGLRIGASRCVFHALAPAILGQRVTGLEAKRSWAGLCRALGDPAPGPAGLRLPPAPERVAVQPYWWFHRFGIERRRADTLVRAARVADRLEAVVDGPIPRAREVLAVVNGVGPWTVAETLLPALGDLDAVSVGDFHLRHQVAYALAGEPRATDERMLELLAPWAGHRAVAVRLVLLEGPGAPVYGPRQRIVPIARL